MSLRKKRNERTSDQLLRSARSLTPVAHAVATGAPFTHSDTRTAGAFDGTATQPWIRPSVDSSTRPLRSRASSPRRKGTSVRPTRDDTSPARLRTWRGRISRHRYRMIGSRGRPWFGMLHTLIGVKWGPRSRTAMLVEVRAGSRRLGRTGPRMCRSPPRCPCQGVPRRAWDVRDGARSPLRPGRRSYRALTRCAIADFLLAAWLAWITPLLAALSSWREATPSASTAAVRSPESAASRKRRTAVFSDERTLLLRRRAASLVRMRLIWDLMFATKEPRRSDRDGSRVFSPHRTGRRATSPGYQRAELRPKSATRPGQTAGRTVTSSNLV